ncbi:hypothetical protein ACOSQ3_021444 [Xanthoceras sorbifolium]
MVGKIFNLEYLDLFNNKLSDPIPSQIMNCLNLQKLRLRKYNLSRRIPLEIGKLKNLNQLDLSYNFINGMIPSQFIQFTLTYVDISYNNLSGAILDSFYYSMTSLSFINLSYNHLEGEIKGYFLKRYSLEAFIDNKGLCSDFGTGLPTCTSTSTLSASPPIVSKKRFIKMFLHITYSQFKSTITKSGDVFLIWNYNGKIAYEDRIEATEDFNIKYCIGTRNYVSVYKAQLPNGKVPTFTKSFENEVCVLSELRHRNIVRLYGICLHKRCMFLVYEYMDRGSLFCVLHNDDEAIALNWTKRVNIIKGVAHALSYLHHNCTLSIVHRDISSNNILLNSKSEAFLADFKTARFLNSDSSNRTILAGTYGYIAPGSIPSQVGRLSKLKYLDLGYNNLAGTIPPEIGNLRNLTWLYLDGNKLTGHIPPTLGHLTKLELLNLRSNQLSGQLPQEIGNLRNLTGLHLDGNKLTEHIPPTLGHLTKLEFLYLGYNNLIGPIPHQLTQLTNLKILSLSSNLLSGQIPLMLGKLCILQYLDLSNNKLSGPITSQIVNCLNLQILRLRNNSLSGIIPLEMDLLQNLSHLDLSYNFINGTIPSQFIQFTLTYLDISHNNLSGAIPDSFYHSMTSLSFINLSYNHLEGEIKGYFLKRYSLEAFIDNKGLCSDFGSGLPPCTSTSTLPASPPIHSKKCFIRMFLPITMFFVAIIIGILYLIKCNNNKDSQFKSTTTKSGDVFSIWNYDGKIAYEDIIEATEDFDIKYCIGTGGYGSVYKAQLPSGKVVALKKLHRSDSDEPTFTKSFENEVRVLSKIRHRNIMKLHGFCLHKRSMFLVYEYMDRGSLFCVLHNDDEAIELNWTKRMNIIKGTAHALSYLHHNCTLSIVHRDISSNNILLNSKSKAFLSDFGTARFLHSNSSNRTILVGTYGYIAPELLSSLASSSNQDIMLMDILDPRLSPPVDQMIAHDVVLVSSVAFACLHPNPKSRPSMQWVSREFLACKTLMPKPIHEISIAQLRNVLLCSVNIV